MKISVVIPVYNKEKTVKRTIDSILSQDFEDFEIILVDDKSRDSSVEIIEQMQNTVPQIKFIKLDSNSGPMYARMEGCRSAEGDFIVFCDADDTLPSDALRSLYDAIIDDNTEMVFSNYSFFALDNTVKERRSLLPYGYDTLSVYKALLDWKAPHSLCGKIFKRDLFVNYKYTIVKNMNNGEDGWMLYQLLNNVHKVSIIEKITYNYIEDSNSTTHQKYTDKMMSEMIRSNVEIAKIALNYSELKPYVYKHVIRNYIYWCASGYSWHKIGAQLEEYGFKDITKIRSLYFYYPVKRATSLLVLKYIKGVVNYFRNK